MPARATGGRLLLCDAGAKNLNESPHILRIVRRTVISHLRNQKVQQKLPPLIGEEIRSGGRD